MFNFRYLYLAKLQIFSSELRISPNGFWVSIKELDISLIELDISPNKEIFLPKYLKISVIS